MHTYITKGLALIIAIVLCFQFTLSSSAQTAPENTPGVKELNFVFLHGAPGTACSMQLLADSIVEQLPSYIFGYEQENPGTKIRVNTLLRCYPNDVDIETWANNIADAIDEHFRDKKNVILVGHSMGGKTALYAVARNVGNLADKVAMVITINSPVKSMNNYYFTGGGSVLDYWGARMLISDQGIIDSVAFYDSSKDGKWVGSHKHWLAFISGEAAPLSNQFDVGGVDPLPRDMDDLIIPISAQYSDGADVVYYGEHSHNDFTAVPEVAWFIASQILHYIFGGSIECSAFAKKGTFEHKASWLPVMNSWQDIVGEVLADSGKISHANQSFFSWQEWEDVVGDYLPGSKRSSYQVSRVNSFPFFTSVKESHWLNADDSDDCRLYVRTRAAPRTSVQVDWSIYQQGLLPEGSERDHYEVEIDTGTPSTGIAYVSWVSDDPRDLRLSIRSSAEGPFRWLKAEWRVYVQETRERKVIDEIPEEALPVTTPNIQ